MYDYFNGNFIYKSNTKKGFYLTIETGGIGYNIEIMERDFIELPKNYGETLKVYTVLLHKEDKMNLCGFLKREDRDIFNILTSVSGVGAKMALTLLNYFEVISLVGFVLEGDYKSLTKAKGVGPKLAQKIILELKDKLTNYNDSVPVSNKITVQKYSQEVEDAQSVLLSLGYSNDEITGAMSRFSTDTMSAEDILKNALKNLSM